MINKFSNASDTVVTVFGGTASGISYLYSQTSTIILELVNTDYLISIISFCLVTCLGATISYFIKKLWDSVCKKDKKFKSKKIFK